MATRFHINMKTGNVSECRAQPGHCPLKNENDAPTEHFPTKEAAQKAYENLMREKLFHNEDELSVNQMTRRMRTCINENPVLSRLEKKEGLLTNNKVDERRRMYGIASTVYMNRACEAAMNHKSADTVNGYRRLSEIADVMSRMELYISRTSTARSSRLDCYTIGRFMATMTKPLGYEPPVSETYQYRDFIKDKNFSDKLKKSSRTITTEEGREVTINKAVIGTDDDGERLHLSAEQRQEIKAEIKKNGDALMNELGNRIPNYYSSEDLEGFTFVGSGAEGVVYLHEKSMIVYKIPHDENPYFYESRNDDSCRTSRKINSLFRKSLKNAGRPPRGYKYLPTFPITAGKKKIGIIAQPYMEHTRFLPYNVDNKDSSELVDRGFCDIHSGNVKIDMSTRTIYMHDCLTWDKTDTWNTL